MVKEPESSSVITANLNTLSRANISSDQTCRATCNVTIRKFYYDNVMFPWLQVMLDYWAWPPLIGWSLLPHHSINLLCQVSSPPLCLRLNTAPSTWSYFLALYLFKQYNSKHLHLPMNASIHMQIISGVKNSQSSHRSSWRPLYKDQSTTCKS